MPRMSALEGVSVLGTTGKRLGTVTDVLFHPSSAKVIGFVVTRPRAAGIVTRPPVYVPLAGAVLEERGVVLGTTGLPSARESERVIGASWDATVLWKGMPVRSTSGASAGAVSDVAFEASDGTVRRLSVSTGILGDLAVGKLDIAGELVTGFDGDAVVIDASYADVTARGGAAKIAAKTTAVAKDAGSKVARQAYDASMSAAIAVGKSFKSGTGRRMLDKFRELTHDDEE